MNLSETWDKLTAIRKELAAAECDLGALAVDLDSSVAMPKGFAAANDRVALAKLIESQILGLLTDVVQPAAADLTQQAADAFNAFCAAEMKPRQKRQAELEELIRRTAAGMQPGFGDLRGGFRPKPEVIARQAEIPAMKGEVAKIRAELLALGSEYYGLEGTWRDARRFEQRIRWLVSQGKVEAAAKELLPILAAQKQSSSEESEAES